MKLLYICTHNRCRSILSEAITQQRAAGLIEARSAGSSPAGQVHPMTLHHLEQQGYATQGLRSTSWGDFADWEPDVVITVCDRAAQEPCPLYFGRAHQLHWSLARPVCCRRLRASTSRSVSLDYKHHREACGAVDNYCECAGIDLGFCI